MISENPSGKSRIKRFSELVGLCAEKTRERIDRNFCGPVDKSRLGEVLGICPEKAEEKWDSSAETPSTEP